MARLQIVVTVTAFDGSQITFNHTSSDAEGFRRDFRCRVDNDYVADSGTRLATVVVTSIETV